MDVLFANYFKAMNGNVARIDNRRETVEVGRKAKRDTVNFARRNINANISPFITPTPKRPLRSTKEANDNKVEEKTIQNPSANVIPSRVARLAKWKAEKTKQKEIKKANSKPIFKVCHVPSKPVVDLENANKFIKGRPIKNATPKVSKFAPVNHKFRPPNGVQPLQLKLPSEKPNEGNTSKPSQKQRSPTKNLKAKKITKSKVTDCTTKLPNNNSQKPPLKAVRKTQKNEQTASSSKSSEFPQILAKKNIPPKSKTKKKSVVFAEIKPLERQSKDNVTFRKTPKKNERLAEEIKGKGSSPDYPVIFLTSDENDKFHNSFTVPNAGAEYFSTKLDNEIARITAKCDTWRDYLQSPDLPEEAQSSIDVCLGQSNLLISKKFEQFRSLIIECQTKSYSEKPITCEDLHGFWDMVYMQVEDLDRRFANLEQLKANNWQEILPEKKMPEKRSKERTKKVQVSSKLKEMIQQARQKKTRNITTSGNTPSQCGLSPGLTMMKISRSIKTGDGLTPAKSILKTDASKSSGRKSVVFMEEISTRPKAITKINLFNNSDKENVSNNLNLISFSPVKLTPRRSVRLTKKKFNV